MARDRLPTLVRIASMLGHLLTSFSYIGLFMACALCTQSDGLTRKSYAYLFYITAFIVVGCIYAGFIASRNVSLAYLILAFAGAILGFSEETQSYRNGLRMGTLSLIIPLVFTLSFSSAVFNDRIYCAPPSSSGNTTEQHLASDYFLANCKDFSIECFSPEQAPNSFLKNLWSNCRTCPSTMLYLNHGIINFSQIISSKTRGDTVLFTLLNTIARRTGLEPNDEKVSSQRIYGPGGTTLADAAHHDYGWPGVMVAATLLGVIWGTGIAMISRGRLLRSLGLCTYVITFYILAVSTIFVGTNILPFPFVAFSSTLTFAWLALRRKEAKQNQE